MLCIVHVIYNAVVQVNETLYNKFEVNMEVMEMEKNGDCLFQSIANALEIENGPATLRELLACAIEDPCIQHFLDIVLNIPDKDRDRSICAPEMVARLKDIEESQRLQFYRDCIRNEKMFADELCIRCIADLYHTVNHHIIYSTCFANTNLKILTGHIHHTHGHTQHESQTLLHTDMAWV